ncbi:zf-DHHC-domain-containing protein [Serendipita vermifera]|nr:zf-DHHC-domain-containing protein [Serendipita vermifera]
MPRPPQTTAGKIWVGGVTCLIAFIAYSSQIFIIWPWYGRVMSVDLLVLVGPFNLLVAFLYWNYFLCVYTDPGEVPPGWEPDLNSEGGFEVKALTGQPRYCRHCENYKPPRTHHCRKCKKCILRMDHHCPWVDNCIGQYNYAHFIRFLWAVDIACSYHLAMMCRRVWYALAYQYWEPAGLELVFLVANFAACIPVLTAVGLFSIYHFYCLLTNTTTVEGWEKDKVATLMEYPYNLGWRRNFLSVFGWNPLFWCWPPQEVPGDGLRFPVAAGTDPLEQYYWPPKDPYRDPPVNERPIGSSPWTFGENELNPALVPSNTSLRARGANVPPYHPSFNSGEYHSDASTSSSPERESHSSNEYLPLDSQGARRRDGWQIEDEDVVQHSGMRMRRGSEGWEATIPDRFVQLRDEGPFEASAVVDETPDDSNRGRRLTRI